MDVDEIFEAHVDNPGSARKLTVKLMADTLPPEAKEVSESSSLYPAPPAREAKMTSGELVDMARTLVACFDVTGADIPLAHVAAFEGRVEDKLSALHAIDVRLRLEKAALDVESRRLADRSRRLKVESERVRGHAVNLLAANEDLTGRDYVETPALRSKLVRQRHEDGERQWVKWT